MTAVDLTNVSYAYPDAPNYVLEGLDLSVPAGLVAGIVGASSAGKTTLAKVLTGFVPHAEGGDLTGGVNVDGVDLPAIELAQVISHVGLITQNPFNQISGAKFTVLEEIAFGLENLGTDPGEMRRRCRQVGERLDITHLLDRSPYELSGGQQQLVAIASMLVMQTPVLVMDEPTSQLDPSGTRMVFDVISEIAREGITVVLFEHKVELLHDHCQQVGVLYDGHLVRTGTPDEVFTDPRLSNWGMGPTRFTEAARAVTGLTITGDYPVSRDDAVTTFTTAQRAMGSASALASPTDEPALPEAVPAAAPAPVEDEPAPATGATPSAGETASGRSIDLDDVHYRYPSGVDAVCGVSLHIDPGERVAIVGQNGAGKTTLVRHLVGIFQPDSGTVSIGGEPTAGKKIADLAALVGYVFQNPDEQIFARTVEGDVRFGPTNLGYQPDRIDTLVAAGLERTGLTHAADTHPLHLSLSERKRVALAGVLAMDTPVVVLDEPTTGQDYRAAAMIGGIVGDLHKAGCTVISVTHNMDFCVEHFDRVIAMAHGQILADGSPAEVFSQPDVLRDAAIEAPQLMRLTAGLGWHQRPLVVDDFVAAWREHGGPAPS